MKKKSTAPKSAPVAKPEPVKDQPVPNKMCLYLATRLIDTSKNLGLDAALYTVNGYRVTVVKVD